MGESWASTLVNLLSYSFSVSLPDKVRRAEEQAAAMAEHNVCTPDPQADIFGASSITFLAGNAGRRWKLYCMCMNTACHLVVGLLGDIIPLLPPVPIDQCI